MTPAKSTEAAILEALAWADQPLDRCIERDLPALKAFHVLAAAYRSVAADNLHLSSEAKRWKERACGAESRAESAESALENRESLLTELGAKMKAALYEQQEEWRKDFNVQVARAEVESMRRVVEEMRRPLQRLWNIVNRYAYCRRRIDAETSSMVMSALASLPSKEPAKPGQEGA